MAVEDPVGDQIDQRDLGLESVHDETLQRHVLDDVAVLVTVGDGPLGERADVEGGDQGEVDHLRPDVLEVRV